MTPIEIGGAIQSAKALFDIAKGLSSAAKKINDIAVKAEVNDRIIDLQQHLMELQVVLIQLREENQELRRQLEGEKIDMRFEKNVCWRISPQGVREPDPYCPRCWEENRKAVHLTPSISVNYMSCLVHQDTDFKILDINSRVAE